jgi:acetyl-CoA carboxylase carboxyltransferase component
MTWQPELGELAKREAFAKRMGGPDKVKRQHDAGRLTIRERVEVLIDQGSLHEIGTIAGKAVYDENNDLVDLTPSNSFLGRARINGRPVVVVGDDFTVRGGSADATIKEKNMMAERMAHELCIPIVRCIEGSGGGGSVKTIETRGRANLPGGVGQASGYHLGHRALRELGTRSGGRSRRSPHGRQPLLGDGQRDVAAFCSGSAGCQCARIQP